MLAAMPIVRHILSAMAKDCKMALKSYMDYIGHLQLQFVKGRMGPMPQWQQISIIVGFLKIIKY